MVKVQAKQNESDLILEEKIFTTQKEYGIKLGQAPEMK